MAQANRVRRRHGAEFKQRVLAECDRPGASVAAVALSHGVNANLVHKWRRQRRPVNAANASFVPVRVSELTAPSRLAGVIRVDAVWLAVEPVDLRLGPDSALARVVAVFGAAQPHHAYLFTNRRANRLKVLVHDGFGLWLAVRRLHQGRFVWAGALANGSVSISRAQFDALVLGLPWQMLAHGVEQRGVISVL